MAATSKKKSYASSTSEEDYSSSSSSSSDEDQRVAKPKPTNTTNTSSDSSSSSKRTRTHSSSSSDSESDPEPPKKNLKFKGPLKPSSPPSDEDEDGDNEEEKKKKKKLKASAPDKKNKKEKQQLKASAPDEPPPKKSKKSAGAIVRLWSAEDEIIFLQALSHYRATKGHLPHEKDYGSFLATIRGSISFSVTENQIGNKLRHMKHIYNKKLKNGTYLTLSEPHEKAVFHLCSQLFEDGTEDVKKKKKEPKGKANAHVQMEEEDGLAGEPNGEANADGHRNLTSHPCLRESIEVAIKEESLGAFSTVEAVIACMGESTAADLEAKIKVSKINALKSKARDGRLKADVMDALAAEMAEG